MMDILLRLIPDVINPLDGLWGRMFNGPMHRFTFRAGSGTTGADVERMLKARGVGIWGRECGPGNERGFLVKRRQAEWAEHILLRGGVPLTSRLVNPAHAKLIGQGRGLPPIWGKGIGPKSFVDYIAKWMGV